MTRFFDLDEANAALPELRTILESLRDERAELIRLRDQVVASQAPSDAPSEVNVGRPGVTLKPEAADPREETAGDAEIRVLRLRMQGVIDQMQAGVARIDEMGVTLREIETGLIDFPALASGRQIWLCWRLADPGDVQWWHELGDGFGGRRALADLT